MRNIIMVGVIALFVALTVVFALNLKSQSQEGPVVNDPMIGQVMPELVLEALPRVTSRKNESSVKIVNFWATWCAPCLAEHPILMDLADRGVEIIGVAYRDDVEKITSFLARQGDPFSTVLLDTDGVAMLDFGNAGVPETFVVGPDNIIRARVRGPINGTPLTDTLLPALKN